MKVIYLCNNKTITEFEIESSDKLPKVYQHVKVGHKVYEVKNVIPVSKSCYAIHLTYIGDEVKLTKVEFMTTRLMAGMVSSSTIGDIEKDKSEYVSLCKSIALEIINQCNCK